MRDLQVGVVGGSIAGTAVAVLLARLGHQVTVFERSGHALEERGGGIGMPISFLDELNRQDLIDDDMPKLIPTRMVWTVRDETSYLGRELADLPMAMASLHWGLIFRQLLRRATDVAYRTGQEVVDVESEGAQATVTTSTGESSTFDLVIGADGYRSVTRSHAFPTTTPEFAGYVAWRGTISEESQAVDFSPVEDALMISGTPRGHSPIYLIPGSDGEIAKGQRRLYWLWYSAENFPQLESLLLDLQLSSTESFAPGQVPDPLIKHLHETALSQLPTWHAEAICLTPQPYVQPIFDLQMANYVNGRVAVMGDAAAVARPHAAAGTTKALQDALAMHRAFSESGSVEEALRVYDTDRATQGRTMVSYARDVAQEHVIEAPDWSAMMPTDFREWMSSSLMAEWPHLGPAR